ncbi:hypothetical protein FB45DRAFT_292102 [Roridomyces roridus]|uniref:Uncharacterized protein n=1 Tax=Roridomyces roridus TaxID=1738132 RepID=A0AAD7CBC5_9AGAR|nr:hypothetical protein FB45DRAFT_292102 [Roridomyces roridus]
MGFFSTRKQQTEDVTASKENESSGFKSLRSRFQVYAKKLDSREHDSPPPAFSQPLSVAQTLSPPTATPIADSHIANRRLHLKLKLSSSSPALNATKRAADSSNNIDSSSAVQTTESADVRPSNSRSRALGTKSSSSSLAPNKTDAVTATLAQQLNELAVANSEGLLDDDDYRMLRQALFQRYASPTPESTTPQRTSVRFNGATVPTDKRQSIDSRRMSISTSSNFVIEKQRTPSVHSRSSMTSGVSNFFRRAAGRSGSHEYSDTSSIFSSTSAVPAESANRFRRLSKKNSASSLNTDRGDTISISSRRTNNASSPAESTLPTASSIRSVRKLPTPPSSFPSRLPSADSRRSGNVSESNSPNSEGPETAETLRREIDTLSQEGRRLLDALSGLEINTLSQRGRVAVTSPRDSVATLIPSDARSVHSVGRRSRKGSDAADMDAISLRSATSVGTAASRTSRRGTRGKSSGPIQLHAAGFVSSSNSTRVGSLHRKNSGSSMASSRLGIGSSGPNSPSSGGGLMVPPVPPLPLGMSLGQMGSTPSLSRSTGHLMGVVHENEVVMTVDLDDEREFGLEMEDLRRRREEVAARYQARIDYLRAKLKSAELHEKLMSK